MKLIYIIKLIKNCDEDSDKEYILEVNLEYLKDLYDLHNNLPFLSKRIKVDKCNKLVCNLCDKKTMLIPMISLKQALNHDYF